MVPIFFALPVIAAEEFEDRGPTDTATPTATVPYRSVFDDYQALSDTGVKSWRVVNEAVGQSNEHAGHAAPDARSAGEVTPDRQNQSTAMDDGADHGKH